MVETKEKTSKWANFWNHFQLPKRKVNEDDPFFFNLYDWKTDGMIFLTTALFIPFVFLFIFRFALGMSTDNPVIDNNYIQLIYLAITLISAVVGFMIFWNRDKELFLKSGSFILYCFILIPNVVSFVVVMIASLAGMKSDSDVLPFLSIWTQIASEIIVIILAFVKTSGLKERVKQTFKENWLMLLITTVITVAIFYALVAVAYGAIFKNTPLSLSEASNNQSSLEDGLSESHSMTYRVFYAISLFVLTVLIAPITEELASRNAWFAGVGNKTLGLFTTALFFGMLHTQSGDVEHILNYVLAGFILSSVFLSARGNVTYNWLTHAGYNLVTIIVIFTQKF
ncbi:CPBP family intramembrane glutamic endopeptidase [Mesoplasma lactucae]|uniref:CAAX prenyl protease 2/Lysostaphin resistance protein A-like domain-containing protein n=1 Tax=Mesoplasma lactucae ATCC 49193 TaxID=81460 RepID=A0A291IS88_9MOLU|nr:CPBP family intramembrane glutamic endopeptidase [Mesoplasma lactucae]ATG97614.1 hypothetical protein CP520_02625 [Mesoplasma lactucae ATCC 49193]ATZ19925.1 CAAX amino terminal membrane bound protease [Mesoplasma lactucae ATCC 49193]MCL8216789.1 hypothetical protein [Mesoplasma lactucae ATCC 49193]